MVDAYDQMLNSPYGSSGGKKGSFWAIYERKVKALWEFFYHIFYNAPKQASMQSLICRKMAVTIRERCRSTSKVPALSAYPPSEEESLSAWPSSSAQWSDCPPQPVRTGRFLLFPLHDWWLSLPVCFSRPGTRYKGPNAGRKTQGGRLDKFCPYSECRFSAGRHFEK